MSRESRVALGLGLWLKDGDQQGCERGVACTDNSEETHGIGLSKPGKLEQSEDLNKTPQSADVKLSSVQSENQNRSSDE